MAQAVAVTARLSLNPSSSDRMRGRFFGKVGSHSGLSLEGGLRMRRRSGTNKCHRSRFEGVGRGSTRGVVEPSAEKPVSISLPAVHAPSNINKATITARVILAFEVGHDDG